MIVTALILSVVHIAPTDGAGGSWVTVPRPW